MSTSAIYELVGYAGSALIVVSLTRKSILKLRVFGLAGAVVFLVYSTLIQAYPIAIVNVVIIFIHIFFLRTLLSIKKEYFTVLRVHKKSRYLLHFIEFHADEIHRFQPGFAYVPSDDQIQVFILRDLVPAGLFIGRVCPDHSIEIKLDFVIPSYRDFNAGKFLYSPRSGVFANPRCDRAWSEAGTELHAEYLERMGFVSSPAANGRVVYHLDLTALHEPAAM